MPVVFVLRAKHIALRGVRGHSALGVEAARIAHNPQQFAVIEPANPVAGHGGVFACGFAQQAVQCVKALFGDRGLPSALTPAFGKLVEDAPGFR